MVLHFCRILLVQEVKSVIARCLMHLVNLHIRYYSKWGKFLLIL